LPLASNSAFS